MLTAKEAAPKMEPPIKWLKKNWRTLVVGRADAVAGCVPVWDLPGASGVYILLLDGTPLYVGSSVNMNARGRQHESWAPADLQAFGIRTPEPWRLGLEGAYIEAIKPRMNQRSPGTISDVPIIEAVQEAWK